MFRQPLSSKRLSPYPEPRLSTLQIARDTLQVGQTVVRVARGPERPLAIWFQADRSAPAF